MSAATARAEADEAASDAILSVSRQDVPWTQAAMLVMRSVALRHADVKGGIATAERLRALADEIGGGA